MQDKYLKIITVKPGIYIKNQTTGRHLLISSEKNICICTRKEKKEFAKCYIFAMILDKQYNTSTGIFRFKSRY